MRRFENTVGPLAALIFVVLFATLTAGASLLFTDTADQARLDNLPSFAINGPQQEPVARPS